MATIEEVVEIRAPLEQVFMAITDPRRTPEWNPSIIDVTGLSSYPIQQGTTWKQRALIVGRTMNLLCRIASWEPPFQGVLQISGDQQAQVMTRCEPIGSAATRVTQRMEFALPGGMAGGLAAKMMVPLLRRELVQAMQRMRDTLERESGGKGGSGTT